MAKLGIFKSLTAGIFLAFFFYETEIGISITSLIIGNLAMLGKYTIIVVPLIIVLLACILIDNKFSGALAGLILGILLFDFPFYFTQTTHLFTTILQGNMQDISNLVSIVVTQLRAEMLSFPFIVEVVTSVSIGFSVGRYTGRASD